MSFWDYFDVCDGDEKKAVCKICENVYNFATTSHNLKTHLRLKHEHELDGDFLETLPSKRSYSKKLDRKPGSGRKKSSKVWEYFSCISEEEKLAQCNLCGRIASYRSTTSNLTSHLKRSHPHGYKEIIENLFKEECEAVYLEFSDSNSEDTPNASDVWSYFDKETGGRARCMTCRDTVPNKKDDMKLHLREVHSKTLEEDDDEEQEIDHEDPEDSKEDIFTEVVYLDEAKEKKKSPKKFDWLHKKYRLQAEKKKRNDSSSSDDIAHLSVSKKKKERVNPSQSFCNEEEIEQFGKYVTCLLKKVPRDTCMQLQLDIVSLIMKATLNSKTETAKQSLTMETVQIFDAVPSTFVISENNGDENAASQSTT